MVDIHCQLHSLLLLSHLYLVPSKILTGLDTAQSSITIASDRDPSAMIGKDIRHISLQSFFGACATPRGCIKFEHAQND